MDFGSCVQMVGFPKYGHIYDLWQVTAIEILPNSYYVCQSLVCQNLYFLVSLIFYFTPMKLDSHASFKVASYQKFSWYGYFHLCQGLVKSTQKIYYCIHLDE